MPYKTSDTSRELIEKINKSTKKEDALILPTYMSPYEKIVNLLIILSLIALMFVVFYRGINNLTYTIIFTLILLISIREFFIQDDRAIVRIYGPLGRIRYLFETEFRDKFLQYFNETNTDGRPIPRIVRDYIYQKAKCVKPIASFGTELDNLDPDNTTDTHLLHLNFPPEIESVSYEVIAGEKRKGIKPFRITNTLNVSAMSYGSINWKAAECISIGAKGIAYVNTGEGGYGPHGVAGNDVIFQIGTGKFGVGKSEFLHDGSPTRILDDGLLKDLVKQNNNIKMIQLKITQGAKPGLGGILPGAKVTDEIAAVRKVEVGKTVVSPSQHAELLGSTHKDSIKKLIEFIKKIRAITELPVGIKLCVGSIKEIDLLVEAIKTSNDGPDAIQVDGFDGGTGAGENIFMNYVGYGSTVETIFYLDYRLKQAGIRDNIVLSASGKLFTPAHAALAFACGADVIDTARGVMLSLGCIQSLKCHTNHCPTGITTNNKWRMRGIVIPEKSSRVNHYLGGFHKDMLHLTKVLGHSDPRDISLDDIRIVSSERHFSGFFDKDPFGINISSNY